MTAAVARPPLFGNLIASRPDREKNSLAATAVSLALHASIILAVTLFTARAAITSAKPAAEVVPFEPISNPTVERQAESSSGGPTSNQPAAPDPFDFSVPNVIPPTIPAPGLTAVAPAPDYVPVARSNAAGPGGSGNVGAGEQPGDFVPLTVVPRLLNRDEVLRSLQRFYPPMLMQAGIGGTSIVWLRIDEEGRVIETRIKQGSGHEAFDKAALDVATRARFSPAYNRDTKVRVWVELPVVFGTK
jgi:periplasmic protein TonB